MSTNPYLTAWWDRPLAERAGKVAREFVRLLLEALMEGPRPGGAEDFMAVLERNAVFECNGMDACASHDFLDANMVMLAAISAVSGIPEDDLPIGTEDEEAEQAFAGLAGIAWDVAKTLLTWDPMEEAEQMVAFLIGTEVVRRVKAEQQEADDLAAGERLAAEIRARGDDPDDVPF